MPMRGKNVSTASSFLKRFPLRGRGWMTKSDDAIVLLSEPTLNDQTKPLLQKQRRHSYYYS
jgi:hypothetical protein